MKRFKQKSAVIIIILTLLIGVTACLSSCGPEVDGSSETQKESVTTKPAESQDVTESQGQTDSESDSKIDSDSSDSSESESEHVHVYDEGVVIKEPTYNEEGIRLLTCTVCKETVEEVIELLPASYVITLGDFGVYNVGPDGKYNLADPEKVGFVFKGWVTADEEEFPASGTVSSDVTVIAVFEILKTTSVEQLEELASLGAEKILIDSDIVIDRPIHIVDATTIYAEKDVKLTRATGYLGDIFVVGIDKDEVPSVLLNKDAILTLDGSQGRITIDGNRDNMTEKVVGSAIFITDSGVVNMYDGITVANHYKDGNERAYICERWVGRWMADRAGGAAVLILNGSFNMYGGVIENNKVRCERTTFVTEDGTESWSEDAGCGGAVYNCGNFNMYGGIIHGNEGLYGGAIYNDEVVRLVAGEISGNKSYSKGGAVASSTDMESEMYIGTDYVTDDKMVFSGNVGETGGALFSNTDSPIIIAGNTVFKNNTSTHGGGAIYTAGGLTVRGAAFEGNTSPDSGGAIYFHYNLKESSDKVRRYLELTDCTFIGNIGYSGGAVILQASEAAKDKGTGAYANVKNCTFDGNSADNCGGFYITGKGEATITDSIFKNNTSKGIGGALTLQTGCIVSCDNVTFENNSSSAAGAMYLYDAKSVSLTNVSFIGNKATDGNGGAIYMNAIKLDLASGVIFKDNSAANHGGAIYASYITRAEDSFDGAELNIDGVSFENNTALFGGAISARAHSVLTVKNASFKGNSGPEAEEGVDMGGGAIYSDFSTLTIEKSRFEGCSSTNGGAIRLEGCSFSAKETDFVDNSAKNGGAIYLTSGSVTIESSKADGNTSVCGGVLFAVGNVEVKIDNTGFNKNTATEDGGVIYAARAQINVSGDNTSFSENSAKRGGAIYLTNLTVGEEKIGAKLTMNAGSFRDNSAEVDGGAISIRSACEATLISSTFDSNAANGTTNAQGGGAIYVGWGVLSLDGVTMKNNTASVGFGGAVNSSFADLTVNNNCFENNTATNGGAIGFDGGTTLTVTNTEFKANSATSGGAVYLTSGSASLKSVKAEENTATAYGGVIYSVGDVVIKLENAILNKNTATEDGGAIYAARADISVSGDKTSFSENSAKRGGAIYLTNLTVGEEKIGAVLNMIGGRFSGNTAEGDGGAIHVRSVCSVTVNSTDFESNSAGGENGGGAVYAAWAALTLNSVTMTDNGAEKGNGGAVCSDNSTVSLSGGEYKNNSAANGGAIYSNVSITVDGGAFEGNNADVYGGAIYLSGKDSSVNGATFNKNQATYGGAIGTTGELELTIADEAVFNENTADDGGAIYSGSSAIVIEGGKTSFTNNSANRGGAIYLGKYSEKGSALTMSGGSFTGNKATVDGGAVSIRSNCSATITNTTFTANTASGTELNQGGGAIYVGWGALDLDGVTMTANTVAESGLGSAVNADNASLTVKGKTVIENNSVHLTKGKLITVIGALDDGSVITVSASDGAFATVDGVAATDIEVYKDFFKSEIGKPIYVKDNMLYTGLIVTAYPSTFNDFTAESTADTYKWYLADDTERENVVCEGKTLSGVEEGKAYVCVMSFGSHSIESEAVLYYEKKTHSECGANCSHSGENAHESIEYRPITNEKDLYDALLRGGNYYLANDIEISSTLYAEKEANLCLNGKILYAKASETAFTMIKSKAALTITDCTDTERVGYIDPATGLWVEGTYSGEGEANVVTLNGGIIMGGHGQWGGAINAAAALEIYNVNLVNNNATSDGGAIYLNGATMTAENVTLVGNSASNHAGAVYVYGGATLTVNNGRFIGNRALDGGAVNIRSNCTVTFANTVFDSNVATGTGEDQGGGAIYVGWATLDLANVTMTNNSVSEGYGGAVNSSNAILTVRGGSFEENSAANGGAIYVKVNDGENKTATITGAEFNSNSAANGGAIYVAGNGTAIDGASFESNAATYGGAIYALDEIDVSVANSTFTNNSATSDGGAIYASSAKITVSGASSFAENSANRGGAIYLGKYSSNGAVLTMTGGSFTSNTATVDGGAVSVRGSCSASFKDTVFTGNSTDGTSVWGSGGAIYVGNGTLTLDGVTMTGNSAPEAGYGSAINANGTTFNIKGKINITDNSVYLHSTQLMTIIGALEEGTNITVIASEKAFAKGDGVNVTDVTAYVGYFTVNAGQVVYEADGKLCCAGHYHAICGPACSHDSHSGIVYTPVSSESELITALTNGGNYYLTADIEITSAITVSKATNLCLNGKIISAASGDSAFTMFKASNPFTLTDCSDVERVGYIDPETGLWGQGSLDGADTVTLSGGIIMGGHGQWGGAINATAALEIYNVNLVNNNATADGGAIYLNGATMTAENVTLVGNSASNHAGAVYVYGGATLTVNNGRFIGNRALDGGAVNIRSNCTVTFANTVFDSNVATGTGEDQGGGAIYVGWATLDLANVTMTNNSVSEGYGGAVNSSNAILTVRGGSFEENSAANGGAIYVKVNDGENKTATITGAEFNSNSAANGGAIYVAGNGTAIDGASFESNAATYGGAIYALDEIDVSVANSTFTNNSATSDGGAIYASSAKITVSGASSFAENSANRGGAIYLGKYSSNGAVLTMTGGSFTSNTATVDGGAVSVRGSCSASFKDTVFTGNSTDGTSVWGSGGAIYVGNGTLTLDGVTMTGNSAPEAGYGSAINANGTTFNIKGKINITDNSVYLHSTQLMTIIGALEEGTNITVIASEKAFAKGDGVNVTDVTAYVGYFTVNAGQVVYEADGKLCCAGHYHAICGPACSHDSHSGIVYTPVSSESELITALTNGGNYYLTADIEITSAITVSKATNLCLNGKIISAASGDSAFTMFKASNPFTLTDCSDVERVGYIDPETGLWGQGSLDGADTVTLNGGIIMGGHGQWGGAINATAAVEVYNVNFANNSTTSSGGAIYVNGAHTLKVHNATFVANGTAADGGAIYLTGGIMTADGDNRFLYNSANRGGAIYLVKKDSASATLNMTDGVFVGNTASGDGGAVHSRSTCTVTFNSTAFDSNNAGGTVGGGAIFVSWATLNLNTVTMTNNTITNGTGDAIHSDNSTVNVKYAQEADKTTLEALIVGSGSGHKLTFTKQ